MYCSKCGSEMSANAAICPACGQAVASLAPPAPAPLAAASPYAMPVVAPTYSSVSYAGFWMRLVAFVIDLFLRGVAFVVLLIPLVVLTGAGAALGKIDSGDDINDALTTLLGVGFAGGSFAIFMIVSWLYYAWSESSSWQGTPGKKLLNVYVTDLSGQRITFGRASGRYFARIVTSLIPLAIGYILAGLTEKKQALHDMLASCLVLRRN